MGFILSVLILTCALASATVPESGTAPWRPYDLGRHQRRIATRVPGAQAAFDQGLVWAYAFNHEAAARAFQEALRLDPDCAMAWWGLALVNGPHINNPVMEEAQAKTAWEALGQAQKRAAGAPPLERALIEALGARYRMPNPADRGALDAAYAQAMGRVAARFPKDADVAALYAEALMDTRPWDQWTRAGEPQPGTLEILAALRRALAMAPNHPLALHLTIHAYEGSPHPERAKAAADRLRRLVPDAGHLVHMPGHIYARIGDWGGAAEANERAMEADGRYRARQPEIGFYGIYMVHNADFLAYTALMEGRKDVALAQSRAVVTAFPLDWVVANATFAEAYATRYWETLKRFGLWDELLAEPAPDARLPLATACWHALRGTAFAATGRNEEAQKAQAAFEAALPAIPESHLWGSNNARQVMQVSRAFLAGEIAFGQGRVDEAIQRLQEAVRLEDALKYDEPPACVVPARHALGAVLLSAGRAREAEVVYRADLRAYPANFWSLLGLQKALASQGRKPEAAAAEEELRRAQGRAQVRAETSCLCVKGKG
ncbi:MAG: Tetratricopeptide repeat protein [Holophagaceae bacterium]|nr:Tetratricopeptide repeat protein [Holophagaceae bacterium]